MVLANLPVAGSPFQARFSGPYFVKRRVSEIIHLISTPDRRKSTQLCHVNVLKPYFSRPVNGDVPGKVRLAALVSPVGVYAPGELRPKVIVNPDDGIMRGRFKNSESLKKLDRLLSRLTKRPLRM